MTENLKRERGKNAQRWSPADLLHFSDGEIHFLWYFMQGSIMIPETRWSLRRSWGMCARHSFGFVAVEAAFRHGYLHGQAVLYEDLMERADAAFRVPSPLCAVNVALKFRETGPCLMCKHGFGPTSKGAARPELFERGRKLEPVRALAEETAPYWMERVCGRCAGNNAWLRCRHHLREELAGGKVNLSEHRALVHDVFKHITHYARSFVWGYHHTDTVEDRAALIEAIGWLAGWEPWLVLIDERIT